jgi:hypothetical protein
MSNIAERELGREGHARPQLSNGVSAHSIRIRNGQLNWDALVGVFPDHTTPPPA